MCADEQAIAVELALFAVGVAAILGGAVGYHVRASLATLRRERAARRLEAEVVAVRDHARALVAVLRAAISAVEPRKPRDHATDRGDE